MHPYDEMDSSLPKTLEELLEQFQSEEKLESFVEKLVQQQHNKDRIKKSYRKKRAGYL